LIRLASLLLFSHDGFGLGHVRRNTLIAGKLLEADPKASVTIVTGVRCRLPWRLPPQVEVRQIPPLVKDEAGTYQGVGMSAHAAEQARRDHFLAAVREIRPDVILVDRHPYGVHGELREGLSEAARLGARLVLGLRDVLDEPEAVEREIAGPGWDGFEAAGWTVLVYGSRSFLDHRVEYCLPAEPWYCGWVAAEPGPRESRTRPEDRLLVVAAGGGGDGAAVYRLGIDFAVLNPDWTVELLLGPLARRAFAGNFRRASPPGRLRITVSPPTAAAAFVRAQAIVQMAGYNSTLEALVAGRRPVFAPRRRPRQEQLIRARLLAGLDLADVLDEDHQLEHLEALLTKPRLLHAEDLRRAGLNLDGARRAAAHLLGRTVEPPVHARDHAEIQS
jgi:predicted glycosyltransferase